MNDQTQTYDVAVLGAGSGGFAAGRTAAAAGLRTVILEGGAEVGGLCILRGCMPTKALLYASEVLHLCRRAGTWGLRVEDAGFNFAKVMARKDAMIEDFAQYRRNQLAKGRFTFIRAQARFTGPNTLVLSDGRTITAKHFVVATGSVVNPAPLPGLGDVGYITSDEALELEKPPRSMIVLGGGAVATELAQFFARFDAKVTVIQRSEHVLKEYDTDAAQELETVFRREGIDLFTGTKLIGARMRGNLKEVAFEHQGETKRVAAEEVLYALGRVPNTALLNLEAAGVATDGTRIVTNGRMQTSAPHIFAAGDCTGPHEIVHIAIQQGEIAVHNILNPAKPREMDYRLLTSVVFTDPALAFVGLTEKQAAASGVPFAAAKYPFNDHGKSLLMEAKDGFVKLLANPKTGEIIGGSCVGPMAGELIHEIVAAMHKRMTVRELAAMPHYHPTLAEIWTYPAEELADQIQPL